VKVLKEKDKKEGKKKKRKFITTKKKKNTARKVISAKIHQQHRANSSMETHLWKQTIYLHFQALEVDPV